MDLDTMSQKNEAYLARLELNNDNPIHKAAAYALSSSKHLFERGKKTSAKLYGQKLDIIAEQAAQLYESLNSLEWQYKDPLMYSLRNQHDLKYIRNPEQIEKFIDSISKAAIAVREVKIDPIPDGYYNQFLFYFVDSLLRQLTFFPNRLFARYCASKNKKLDDVSEEFIADYLKEWLKKVIDEEARNVAIWIIQSQLNDAKEQRNAQKAVDLHLPKIAKERAEFNAYHMHLELVSLLTLVEDEL